MLRRFPFYPPQYTGSLAASSHVSSLAPTLIPLYKPTPLDYLNYPLRYETLFFFLSWQMQRVSKTPSNPLWNCHQFTVLLSSFRSSSLSDAHRWFTISKTFPEIPLAKSMLNQVSGFCGHYSDTLNGTTSINKRDSQTRFTCLLFPPKSSAVPVFTLSAC